MKVSESLLRESLGSIIPEDDEQSVNRSGQQSLLATVSRRGLWRFVFVLSFSGSQISRLLKNPYWRDSGMTQKMERVTGIEPVFRPWQGHVIATIRYPQEPTDFISISQKIQAKSFTLRVNTFFRCWGE
jgi:hypothetical protein